jgi:glycosyltransferase involved in cell wall biosynthesis
MPGESERIIMESQPLISVIMPVYNAEKYIAEAIGSIRRQGYAPLEILAINDGSTDDSVPIIEGLGADIVVINQANAGPGPARNRGLAQAQGEFITFLDADDLWPEHKLARQMAYLQAHPEIEMVWGRIHYFGDFSERDKKIPLDENQTAVSYQLGSGLFRRSAFDRVGLFDEAFHYSEDYDWLLRAREMGMPSFVLDDITLLYRIHQESVTHAQNYMKFQFPLLLKKSLDRRRRAGGS